MRLWGGSAMKKLLFVLFALTAAMVVIGITAALTRSVDDEVIATDEATTA